MPPAYLRTHYRGTPKVPKGALETAIEKDIISNKTENSREIFNFLNTQGSDLLDLNWEYTLFTALIFVPRTQQVKVVYGMGLETSSISQKYPIVNKVLTLYGEGGPGIGPSQTLVLDITVQDKVLVKNLTPEGVQKVFNNEHVVDQQLERASNVIDEEETMKISPMPSYFIYDGFENI